MEKLLTYGVVFALLTNFGNAFKVSEKEFKEFQEFISSFKCEIGDVYFSTWPSWRDPF